ncbi:DUF885 domain-containing protein [Sphingosinicella sp. LHD-64]|uniref:DUF885 domain-containing protein n=1 Tax=Sphingosinicella sp. LHD-64 TaxID=3072139 RepID=UPI00280E8089|nr:DUF885 domain-containing protein [Sphingosinicella sp. LHD-64]MDQ8755912.1 DUF885 domain-containing protein [Sphingosinicella sp. LHD-64]
MKRYLPLAALLLATTGLAGAQPQAASGPAAGAVPTTSATATPNAEDARLTTFLDAAFDESIADSPQTLTSLGSKEKYDRLNDFTDGFRERQMQLRERQLAAMRAQFNPERLSPAGRLSYRLFEEDVEDDRAAFRWRWHSFPATNFSSPMGSIPVFMINNHRIDNVSDAEAYVSRLADVERVMGEISANMRHQTGLGIVPPAFNFAPVLEDGQRILTGAPFTEGADGALFADFKRKVNALEIAQGEKDRLIAAARAALTGPFRRGYETMLETVREIQPRATGNNGAWSLPDGAALYAQRLRQSTTTDLSAEQIHQIGLQQVARIHGEMERIKAQVGFTGTLTQFFAHINAGAEFKYPNTADGREQYLADARRYIAQVMEVAPRWFRRLPRAPLEVRAVEAFRQETAAVAFYNRPSPDGSRPGIYYVNLADMNQVLKPQTEAISYHEGAPGHHFQSALAQELPNVPKFRRFGGNSAYGEGWGLYAEQLGQEMGFYQDPMSEFGMLSTQLWRAIRLVVDTGIHHHRWTREQAIDYFMENGLLSRRDATKEIERYFNIPGQATSYMIGRLKILELRDRARAALGDRFDIRDFHAVVLENGNVPLDVLESLVDAWIAERRNG